MTFLHSAVLWLGPHPGWCLGFPPIPHRDSRHFPKPRKRATPCGLAAKSSHTCAATVQLWGSGSLPLCAGLSRSLKKMRFCLKRFLSRMLVVILHVYHAGLQSVPTFYLTVCEFKCESERCLSVCLSVGWLRASVFVLFHQTEQKIAFLSISSLTTIAFFDWSQTNFSVAWCFRYLSWFVCFFCCFFYKVDMTWIKQAKML